MKHDGVPALADISAQRGFKACYPQLFELRCNIIWILTEDVIRSIQRGLELVELLKSSVSPAESYCVNIQIRFVDIDKAY